MSNYYIIGGDGRQYGPITDGDIRKWTIEGRLGGQTQTKAEGDAEWRLLSTFPEFADLFASMAPAEPVAAAAALPVNLDDHDYELDLTGCIGQGWNIFKENFGTLFLAFLVAMLVSIGFAVVVGGITSRMVFGPLIPGVTAPVALTVGYNYILKAIIFVVAGPVTAGCYLVFLRTIRREPTGVGDVFEGFQRCFLQLFLGGMVIALITGAFSLPIDYYWGVKSSPLWLQFQQAATAQDMPGMQNVFFELVHAFFATAALRLICLLPVTYLTVSWLFTLPLIIDKRMTFGAAMKTSWKMVGKHWWQVFGLLILVGLISALGLLGCGIGVLLTMPIGTAASMIAYETIFRPAPKS